MIPTETPNPYQAPEASLAALEAELPRPPVYTAISWFCWLLGTIHVIGSGVLFHAFTNSIERFGWRKAFLYLAWPSPRPLLMIATMILAASGYLTAGRLLWTRRGRPGLILCSTAIGLTYLCVWFLRPR